MNEHQLLDELAADAPTPGPRFAEDILVVARRRRRRVWAVASASVGAVVIAVAVPVAVQLGRSDNTSVAAGPSRGSSSSRVPTGPPAVARDEVAEIYAAALKYAVLSGRVNGTSRTEVRGSTCTNLDVPTSLTCRGERPIRVSTRQEVLTLLPDGSKLRFVDGPSSNPPGSKTVLFVSLGPARVAGKHARVFVQSWCGFDCVQGQGLLLAVVDGRWQATGTYGGYIS